MRGRNVGQKKLWKAFDDEGSVSGSMLVSIRGVVSRYGGEEGIRGRRREVYKQSAKPGEVVRVRHEGRRRDWDDDGRVTGNRDNR